MQDEIEVALKHNGTGYVAFGWRPSRGIDGSCRAEAPGNFPTGTAIIKFFTNYKFYQLLFLFSLQAPIPSGPMSRPFQ